MLTPLAHTSVYAKVAQKFHNVVCKQFVVELQLEVISVALFALSGGRGNVHASAAEKQPLEIRNLARVRGGDILRYTLNETLIFVRVDFHQSEIFQSLF